LRKTLNFASPACGRGSKTDDRLRPWPDQPSPQRHGTREVFQKNVQPALTKGQLREGLLLPAPIELSGADDGGTLQTETFSMHSKLGRVA
jgi:hypothetical protein